MKLFGKIRKVLERAKNFRVFLANAQVFGLCVNGFRDFYAYLRLFAAQIWKKEEKLKERELTRPSILCVTQKRAFMPLYIVLGQKSACMPVYIGKSGDLVRCHRCLTDRQQKIELLSFSTVSS